MLTVTIGDTRSWPFPIMDPATGDPMSVDSYDRILFRLSDPGNKPVLTRDSSVDVSAGKMIVALNPLKVEIVLLGSEWGGLKPGFYTAALQITVDGQTLPCNPVEVQILPNRATASNTTEFPITIDRLRMFLMDKPAYNKLLDAVEMTDEELLLAAQMAVDQYNETPPLISNATINSFPSRTHLILGSASYALRILANRYRRNRLDVHTGGMIADDDAKEPEYLRAAGELLEIYTKWVDEFKMARNFASWFGVVGSDRSREYRQKHLDVDE